MPKLDVNYKHLLIGGLLFFLIILAYFVYNEYTYIKFIFQYIFMNRPWGALPLQKNVQELILQYIDMIPHNNYTFIDFGCADGNIIELFHKKNNNKIKNFVCIELEKKLTDVAMERFKNNDNVSVLNQDMLNYKYEIEPTILFLFEPLWTMQKDDAVKIYTDIFNKIPKEQLLAKKIPFYIIYVSGVKPHLNETYFNNIGYILNEHSILSRFFGFKKTNVYLFKLAK
jgi:hypothetical protein